MNDTVYSLNESRSFSRSHLSVIVMVLVLLLCIAAIVAWYWFQTIQLSNRSVRIENVGSGMYSENNKGDISNSIINEEDENLSDIDFKPTEQYLIRETMVVPARTSSTMMVDVPYGLDSVQFVMDGDAFVGNNVIDPDNVVRESIAANSVLSREPVRTYFVKQPKSGQWIVEFINKDPKIDSNTSLVVRLKGFDQQIKMSVEVKDSGVIDVLAVHQVGDEIVSDNQMQFEVESQTGIGRNYLLYDDGVHNDLAAGDGVFGGSSEALAIGGYFVIVRSSLGSVDLVTMDSVFVD